MVIDNDTRGWIMSCVSGAGKLRGTLSLIAQCLLLRSLRGGFEYNMRRLDHQTYSWQAELQSPGQQSFSIFFAES